jgi:hypothetical protein
MSIAPSSVSVASPHSFDSMLIGASLEEEAGPVVNPALAAAPVEPPPAIPQMDLSAHFRAILRSNLRAAAQHIALGHEGPTFRQCHHGSCRDGSNLVPHLVATDLGITDAELDALFNRAPAALEMLDLQEELAAA